MTKWQLRYNLKGAQITEPHSSKQGRRVLHAKAVESEFERVWKRTRVEFAIDGLVNRWRGSLGDRKMCSVPIQRY